MKWTEYFKIEFKKPDEDDTLRNLRLKKQKFEEGIAKSYSRLETIEICTSNSKLDDAILLMNVLYLDLYNLLLFHSDENPVKEIEEESTIQQKIKDPKFREIFLDFYKNFSLSDTSEDNILKQESLFSDLLYKIEKISKPAYENPLDNFKNRIKVQSVIVLILVLLSAGSGLKKYLDHRPLNKDTVSLNTTDKKEALPVPETEVSLPTNPEAGWETLRFQFSTPRDIEILQINPIHQNKARIQIKDLNLFDEKGGIIFQKDLKIENLDITYLLSFMKTEEIYPGKIEVGRSLEIESTGINPKIFITFEKKLEKVSKIEFSIRATKRVNQYKE